MSVQDFESAIRSPRNGVVEAIVAGNPCWGEMFLHLQEAAIADRSELPAAELKAIGRVVSPYTETSGSIV